MDGRPVVLFVLAVFFVVGSAFVVTGLWDLAGALRLRREGQTVDAVVTNKDIRSVARKGRSEAEHILRYRVQAAGAVAEPGDVEGWQADDPAKVRFDRARPQDSVWIGRG